MWILQTGSAEDVREKLPGFPGRGPGTVSYTHLWQLFLAGAFTQAVPGIVLHIVLIPLLVLALRKAKLMD